MGVYRVELEDGQAFDVDADSPEIAQEAVLSQFKTQAPPPKPPKQPLGEFILDRAPITGEVREIYGQLASDRPTSGLKAGLAAASLASLPLSAGLRVGTGAARLGLAGIKEALAAATGGALASGVTERMDAPAPVQMAAGLVGGLAGGRMAMPKTAPVPAKPAAELIQNADVPFMQTPATAAETTPAALGMAGAVRPETKKTAAAMAKEWLGEKPLTMGQMQELEAPGVGSMNKLAEFRMVASDKAASALADIADKSRAIGSRLQQISGVSADMPKGKAGSALASRYSELMDEAGRTIGEAEDAVKALPTFDKVKAGFREPIIAELDNIAKENRLTGNLVSRVPDSERAFFGKVVQKAKKVGTIHDVMEFRRWLRNEIKDSQRNLSLGTGDFIDTLESRIYQSVDNALGQMPLDATEKAAVQKFMEASKGYYTAKFSPEAKAVRDTLGFKGAGLALEKSPEQIVEGIFKGQRGLAGKLDRAAESGLIDKGEVQAAAWAKVFEDTIDNGVLDAGKLRKIVNGMEESQGEFLFGPAWKQLKKASDVADVVTYAKRYAPQTGFGAQMLEKGRAFGGAIPGASTIAQKVYYAAPSTQKILAPGNLVPKTPQMPKYSKAGMAPTLFQALKGY